MFNSNFTAEELILAETYFFHLNTGNCDVFPLEHYKAASIWFCMCCNLHSFVALLSENGLFGFCLWVNVNGKVRDIFCCAYSVCFCHILTLRDFIFLVVVRARNFMVTVQRIIVRLFHNIILSMLTFSLCINWPVLLARKWLNCVLQHIYPWCVIGTNLSCQGSHGVYCPGLWAFWFKKLS